MIKFAYRIQDLLDERDEVLNDLQSKVGVNCVTIRRGVKNKSTIAAIAYYFNMDAAELVAGTDVEEIWYKDTSKY